MTLVLIKPGGSDDEDPNHTPKKHQLYEACLSGTAEDILRCLDDIDTDSEYFEDGTTPLHVVALSDRNDAEDILEALLRKGFDINARTKDGDDTPLHLVARLPDSSKVFPLTLKLMEYNPDLFIRNRGLRTPLDNAIAVKHYDLAEVLDGTKTAKEAKDFYNARMVALYAPRLLKAVLESDMEAIKECVQCGADPNFINEHGCGAIHYAVTHCILPVMEVVQILIDAGVDVNLKDHEDDTVLNLVIKTDKLRNQMEMSQIVSLLLAWGAATDIQDLDGKDAVAHARERHYDDIVNLLTDEEQPAVRIPSPIEAQPVPSVIYEEPESEEDDDFVHPPPAQISLPQGEDNDTLNPLHKAVLLEDPDERREQIEELLSAGADINAKTTDTGDTALHLAADINFVDTVQQLLQFHANKTIRNKQDKTPFLVAKNKNHEEIMVLLADNRSRNNWKKAKKAKGCTVL